MEELYKDGGTEAVCADVRTVWGSGLAWGTKNTLLQILHIYHQRKASNPWILTFNELNWENVFLLKASRLIYTVLIVPLSAKRQRVNSKKLFWSLTCTRVYHCLHLSVSYCLPARSSATISLCSSHTELWSPVGDSQLTWNTGEQKYSGRRERNDDDSNVEAFAIKRIWGLKVQRRCAPTYFCLVVILIILKWNSSNFLQTLLMCT